MIYWHKGAMGVLRSRGSPKCYLINTLRFSTMCISDRGYCALEQAVYAALYCMAECFKGMTTPFQSVGLIPVSERADLQNVLL